jgi:hypothetical protein
MCTVHSKSYDDVHLSAPSARIAGLVGHVPPEAQHEIVRIAIHRDRFGPSAASFDHISLMAALERIAVVLLRI